MRRLPASFLLLLLASPVLAAQDNAAAPPRRSWTSDRIRLGVGDVVTILIDEQTLASANLRENAGDRRSRTMTASAALPGGTAVAASVAAGRDDDSRRSGESVRGNNFTGEVSARVVAVSPTGMLQVEGQKELRVDKAKQTITISGWVRPNDIAVATNTIESWRLADAQIAYQQKGRLGRPRGGLITRLLGVLWP